MKIQDCETYDLIQDCEYCKYYELGGYCALDNPKDTIEVDSEMFDACDM